MTFIMNSLERNLIKSQEEYIKYLEEQLSIVKQSLEQDSSGEKKIDNEFNEDTLLSETIYLNDFHNIPTYFTFNIEITSKLTEFKVINMNLSFLTSCRMMFMNCRNLKTVIWRNSVTKPIDCSYMFNHCSSLEEVEISGLYVTNAKYMFHLNSYFSSIKLKLDLEIDFTYCISMVELISFINRIDVLDFSKCKPSKVMSFDYISIYCPLCSKIVGLEGLISNCYFRLTIDSNSLDELDLSKINNHTRYKFDYVYFEGPIYIQANKVKVLKYPEVSIRKEWIHLCLPDSDNIEVLKLPDLEDCDIILDFACKKYPEFVLNTFENLLKKNNRLFVPKSADVNMNFIDDYDEYDVYYRDIYYSIKSRLHLQIYEE